ncbi:ATP/GTP-binding protein [Xylariaceae sp. FL0594]|nr:ATP/GTP-binding protein [Xylariaceae sp. FL0594]
MEEIIEQLLPRISRSASDPRPVVVMMCGIAGAGKSTLSKALVSALPSFTRLSLDGIVAEKHGICGVDYDNANGEYDRYLDEAWEECKRRLAGFLRPTTAPSSPLTSTSTSTKPQEGKAKDVVFDRAFWNKADRDEARRLISDLGGRSVLLYLKAPDKETLWRRICGRREEALGMSADGGGKGKGRGKLNADCAFEITPEILDMYWSGFEEPGEDEGAIVVDTVAGRVDWGGVGVYRPK